MAAAIAAVGAVLPSVAVALAIRSMMDSMNRKRNDASYMEEFAASSFEGVQASGHRYEEESPFEIRHTDVEANWYHHGRHWHMGQALGIEDFEDYWTYLSAGRKSLQAEPHFEDETLYSMAVTPLFDDSGRMVDLIVNNIYASQEYGMSVLEYVYSVPKEENRQSAQIWRKQQVTIRYEDGENTSLTLGDFVGIKDMTMEEMMEILNDWIQAAPFNRVFGGPSEG